MTKKNATRNNRRPDLSKFDRVYIELPEAVNTARIVAIPLKTIFYNSNALGAANLDRVFYDICDLEDFLDACGVNIG